MTTLLDKIKGKRQDIKENRAAMTRAYKFKPGKTVISLLPLHEELGKTPAERQFWREYGMHFIKNSAGEMVVCVGDRSLCFPGETCPVREGLVDMIRYGTQIGDDAMVKTAKDALANKSYLINIMVHQDPDMKKEEAPVLASISESLFDQLGSVLEEYLASDSDLAMRWDDRLMLIVEREGTGMKDTRYKIYPAAKRIGVDQSVMTKAVNLDEFVKGQFADSVAKALTYISTATGRTLKGSSIERALTAAPGSAATPALAASPAPAAVEDLAGGAAPARAAAAPALAQSRAVDAAFTEVPAPAPAAATEDLLAEIDNLAA